MPTLMLTETMRSLRGTKRVCRSCDVRFYDLGRDPTVCPSCGVSLPMSGFERVRQEAVGYQPSALRSPKRNLTVVQPEDDASALAVENDADETTDDETSGDADGDILLEEESDVDVADLLTPDESDTGSE